MCIFYLFSGVNSQHEWLQVDFLNPKFVSKLRIAPPDSSTNRHVKRFSLACSLDGWVFEPFKGHGRREEGLTFLGLDRVLTFHLFPHLCRFVRLFPKTWKSGIALRWDLLACTSKFSYIHSQMSGIVTDAGL